MPDEPFQKTPDHHDVFISYAQQDKPIADAVCAKLESRNIRCWIAPRDISPGKSFPEAIIEGIENGKVLVVIFSSYANKSPHVTRELTHAVNKGQIIIPFRIEDVTPSKSMEYLIGVPHWLDAVSPPMEKHIDHLVGTVEHIISPGKKPVSPVNAAPEQVNQQVTKPPEPVSLEPSPPVLVPEPRTARPEPPYHLPEPDSHTKTHPVRDKKTLVAAGIILAVIIILFIGVQTGLFNFVVSPNTSGSDGSAASGTVNYRSSDAVVNTVVLTTEPTQTLAKDTELFVDASKDNSNAMVTVQFNGGPGMGLVKDNRVILTRSDGTVAEDKLNFNQRLSEVKLQGTRGTDRIQVIVTLYSGSEKTIADILLPYRTYH
ncbi:MAG: TIR domain-containing protein [Methanoregula sp.]|nr:TIR domain-containing protein [Methanoregula sp.]